MWMMAMVMATTASLSAILFGPDAAITPELVWPSRAACDVVREAHLLMHPAPDNTGLVCLRVPDHIARKFSPAKKAPALDT